MKRTVSIAAGIAFGMFAASTALAQAPRSPADSAGTTTVGRLGDVQVFAGVRLWANEWDMSLIGQQRSLDASNPTNIILRDEVRTSLTDVEVVPMPTIGARYGKLLASMTYFVPTSYESKGGLRKSVERSELDFTVGYFVLPSLVVSLGYKSATVERVLDDIDSEQKVSAVLLGISGSAPLSDKLSLYGNFAYGPARQKSEANDIRGKDTYSATYAIGELGLTYRFIDGGTGTFVNSLTGSIGYRAQSFTTKDVGLGTYALSDPTVPIATTKRDLRTSTSGVVVALIATF